MSEISLRDLLFVVLPSLLLPAAGFWAAAQFIRPAPPRQIIIVSSGGEGGAYQRFAARYKDVLAHYGIELVEKPSAGSVKNLQRLRDQHFEVDAGFIQGAPSAPRRTTAWLRWAASTMNRCGFLSRRSGAGSARRGAGSSRASLSYSAICHSGRRP